MNVAFKPADILLPKNIDMNKWAVVACDQFTSEPEYWERVSKYTEGFPSQYNLILPECYLGKSDESERIDKIHENMKKYLSEDVFTEYKDSFVYIERMTTDGLRCGIIGEIDLEEYDYNKGSTSPVRATEATVAERIPPRLKVRTGALLESTHIMILIDDKKNTVIEPLTNEKDKMQKLYDFDLMENGGNIKGFLLSDKQKFDVENALSAMYGENDESPLVFAMGDGNHSLATAKEYYEKLKREGKNTEKARYALCEIVNLNSDALKFEPIHRIVSGVNTDDLLESLKNNLNLSQTEKSAQKFYFVKNKKKTLYYIHKELSNLTVGSVQIVLDNYLKEHENSKIDYIHEEETVLRLSENNDTAGILFEGMDKSDLFPTVIKDGALPRKTFSMGHSNDKRYYVESRKLTD